MPIRFPHSLALLAALLLAGCGTPPARTAGHIDALEQFESTATYTRRYPQAPARTCEAARRALLSQGYAITAPGAEQITARKNFQPERELHMEVEFRVVCVAAHAPDAGTIAFASAVQERYELKKANNSASLGVGALGSLSLPFSASNEAMVKVASETLTNERFYDGFFTLMARYLGAPPQPPASAPEMPADPTQETVPLSPTRG